MGAFVLGIPEHKLRVVAPDVGGGFGSKIFHYAEEAFVTFAAKAVGRPVKWTSTPVGGLRVRRARPRPCHARSSWRSTRTASSWRSAPTRSPTWAPISRPSRPAIPTYLHGTLMAGNYATPLIYVNVRGGLHQHRAGRRLPRRRAAGGDLPDRAGHRQGGARARHRPGRDPAEELREARPVPLPDAGRGATTTPATTTRRWTSSSEIADRAGFAARRAESAARGKLRGFGVASYIEACGIAPSSLVGAARRARRPLRERDGAGERRPAAISVFTGSHSHGQGHETTFAAGGRRRMLGIDEGQIDIVHGDTARVPFGMGTYGSRSLAVGGSAIVKATEKIIAKAKKIAAHLMEASDTDVEFKDGKFTVAGTDKSVAWTDVTLAAYVPHNYPIERARAGAGGDRLLRPGELHLPGRRLRLRGRGRPGDRRGRGAGLRRRRRLRQHRQPDDRRGPGARRARAGHRPGAAASRRSTTRTASSGPAPTWTTRCRGRATCRASSSTIRASRPAPTTRSG